MAALPGLVYGRVLPAAGGWIKLLKALRRNIKSNRQLKVIKKN